MKRRNVGLVFLLTATIYWGIWLGGYIFNAVMVIPGWSYGPPGSMIEYDRQSHILVYFFSAVNPWVFLVSLAAWLFIRKVDTAARSWIAWATLIAWIMLPFKVWMVMMIGSVFNRALQGTFDSDSLATMNLWINMNWGTIVIALFIFFMHLLAVFNFKAPRNQVL